MASHIQIIQKHNIYYFTESTRGARNHFCPLSTVYISFLITKTSRTQYHETPLYAWILGLVMQCTKLYWKDGDRQVGWIRLKTFHYANGTIFMLVKTDQGPQLPSFHFSYSKKAIFPLKLKLISRGCTACSQEAEGTLTSSARLNLLSCRRRMYSDFTRFRQHTGPFSDFFPVWPMIILKAMVSY